MFLLYTVPLKSKLPVSSRFSRDESLASRESLKRQFWNKLQADSLARSRLQYCAKVMRTNFDEFRALFSSRDNLPQVITFLTNVVNCLSLEPLIRLIVPSRHITPTCCLCTPSGLNRCLCIPSSVLMASATLHNLKQTVC